MIAELIEIVRSLTATTRGALLFGALLVACYGVPALIAWKRRRDR